MISPDLPGLDVSGRVRARDIQMAGVADVRRRVLMISGAIDTADHDLSLCVNLPEPGRWQVIKSETNLTDQTWVAIQATTDEESGFRQRSRHHDHVPPVRQVIPDPGQPAAHVLRRRGASGRGAAEGLLLETAVRRPTYHYSWYSPNHHERPGSSGERLQQMLTEGLPKRPVIELIVPVTVIS